MQTLRNILIALTIFGAFNLSAKKAEIVICADLSGSTNGMLESLQNALWNSYNTFYNQSKINEVEFALVGYGRKSFGSKNFYAKVIHDLTKDINQIGYDLLKFQMSVEGCDAYAQQALTDAIDKVSWDKKSESHKVIIMIGNGPLVNSELKDIVKKAQKQNIIIKPIYYQLKIKEAELTDWKQFALLTGENLEITNPEVSNKIHFYKNYDQAFITRCGDDYLSTIIPYGNDGKRNKRKYDYIFSELQNFSRENYEELIVYQANARTIGLNKDWDLVDAAMAGELNVNALDIKKLPVFMQSFSKEQISKYINLKVKQRQTVINKIELEKNKRKAYQTNKISKSQHIVGRGGLAIILQQYIRVQFENAASASHL